VPETAAVAAPDAKPVTPEPAEPAAAITALTVAAKVTVSTAEVAKSAADAVCAVVGDADAEADEPTEAEPLAVPDPLPATAPDAGAETVSLVALPPVAAVAAASRGRTG
jgi:hypothetical protein